MRGAVAKRLAQGEREAAVGEWREAVVRKRRSGEVAAQSLEAPSRGSLDLTYDFSYMWGMMTLTASRARIDLYRLLDRAAESHEPVQITGRRASAVLVSDDDWRAIQETLYLLSVPGMRESIRRGLKTPARKLSRRLRW